MKEQFLATLMLLAANATGPTGPVGPKPATEPCYGITIGIGTTTPAPTKPMRIKIPREEARNIMLNSLDERGKLAFQSMNCQTLVPIRIKINNVTVFEITE